MRLRFGLTYSQVMEVFDTITVDELEDFAPRYINRIHDQIRFLDKTKVLFLALKLVRIGLFVAWMTGGLSAFGLPPSYSS